MMLTKFDRSKYRLLYHLRRLERDGTAQCKTVTIHQGKLRQLWRIKLDGEPVKVLEITRAKMRWVSPDEWDKPSEPREPDGS